MADDELNIPTHRYYQQRFNVQLANEDISRKYIYASGIRKIEARIGEVVIREPLFLNNEPGIWLDPSDVADLNWRRNLLTPSTLPASAFGVWGNPNSGTVVVGATGPFGTATAATLTSNGGTESRWRATFTHLVNTQYTWSAYVKRGTARYAYMRPIVLGGSSTQDGAWFDVTNGVVGSRGTNVSASSIQSAGDGWFRITMTATTPASIVNQLFDVGQTNGDAVVTSTSGETMLFDAVQLELGSVATDYQRISNVNTEVLERFPKTTMFQDRAGSTAVTTPGQSVGLRLDKSKGLVLGAELVTNGDFATDTDWIKGTGWTISGGSANYDGTDSPNGIYQTAAVLSSGKSYRVSITVSLTQGALLVRPQFVSATGQYQITSSGTYSILLSGLGGSFGLVAGSFGGRFIGTIDNISVKELPGFHAVANSDAARGIYGIEPLGGRRNLLERTEDFSNAYWTAGAVNLTSLAAGRITPNTTSGQHRYDRTTTIAAAAHTFSMEVKADGYNFIWIRLGAISAVFNTTTGDAAGVASGATASFTNANDGYIRITLSGTAAGNDTLRINVLPSTSTADFAGNGTSGVLLRNAQLETGSTATAYQKVATQYDVTEAGKQTLHYVQYDGSDDGYVTPTITPGTDKVQVFAGVRKLSDAARAMPIELGSGVVNAFRLEAPSTAGSAQYLFTSQGIAASYTNASVAAPVTNVVTGLGDISGDLATLRVNGAQVAQSTTDQGTGNYNANPLYIGRRGGTTLPFNGRDYGIIVRFGANLSSSNINRAEYYVAQKTGVTL